MSSKTRFRSIAAIEAAVEKRCAGEEQQFAVFDFDNTCIVNDIGEATLAYLCGHELLRDRELLGERDESAGYHVRVFRTYYALLAGKKLKAAYLLCARMFSGFTPHEAEAVTLAAITEEGSKLGSKMLYDVHIERGLAPWQSVLSLMRYLHERGVAVWIVSATPESAVRAAMRHFGIEAGLVGMRSVIKDGVFTSALEEPLAMFEGKAACVRKYIPSERAPLLAAGDSESDLPMLEMAEIKVVVDRGGELAQVAHERRWFLL